MISHMRTTLGRAIKQGLLGVLTLMAVLLMGFGSTPLELHDVHTVDCPDTAEFDNLFASGSTLEVRCLFVEGTVLNTSKRTLVNADVFGRMYDANGNDIMPERTRLGAIEEVPPGETPFAIRISVPIANPLPLSLEQFKASGFAGKVRR